MKHKSKYQHANERAWPGYYSVDYDDVMARHEVTATMHCGHHRITFAPMLVGQVDSDRAGVLVDLGSVISDGKVAGAELQIDAASRTATGKLRHVGPFSGRYGGFDVFFEVRWNRNAKSWGNWSDGAVHEAQAATATAAVPSDIGLWLEFDTGADKTAELQVCLSYVDVAGAKANAAAELPSFAFDTTRIAALQTWQDALGKVQVTGGTADERTIFYSSLYRSLNMPTSWTDVDGRYRGFQGVIRKAEGYTYVTDLSLWDTFRTLNPLLVLLYPVTGRDVVKSMQAMIEDGGWAPKWAMGMGDTGSMIGQHAVSVFADSYVKGITDFDVSKVYQNLRHNALGPYQGGEYGRRDQLESYLTRGWIARDETTGSVSKTQEYAFNDYCLSQMAKGLDLPDDATLFAAGAKNYKHLWEPETQFFRARMKNGDWGPDFTPDQWSHSNEEYVEGTAWHWNWFVPHDPDGLRALYPSNDAFVTKLTAFFENAQAEFSFWVPTTWYFHGNEPDILAMTLFLGAGRPDLADKWTRWVGTANYTTAPDGLVGNDDAGTLSAWYVFAASGFLPRPCDAGYDLVAPRFDKVVWDLPGGKLVIEAPGASSGQVMQDAVLWNGQPLTGRWLDHAAAASGGTLKFQAKP
jgi:predicted alpha-1,2-mannosidase